MARPRIHVGFRNFSGYLFAGVQPVTVVFWAILGSFLTEAVIYRRRPANWRLEAPERPIVYGIFWGGPV